MSTIKILEETTAAALVTSTNDALASNHWVLNGAAFTDGTKFYQSLIYTDYSIDFPYIVNSISIIASTLYEGATENDISFTLTRKNGSADIRSYSQLIDEGIKITPPSTEWVVGNNSIKCYYGKGSNQISTSGTIVITKVIPIDIDTGYESPIKFRYRCGESFESAGLSITIYYNNDTQKTISDTQCTYTPSIIVPAADYLTVNISPVMVSASYTEGSITVDSSQLPIDVLVYNYPSTFVITSPMNTLRYYPNTTLDFTGIQLTLTYESGGSTIIGPDHIGYYADAFTSQSTVGTQTITYSRDYNLIEEGPEVYITTSNTISVYNIDSISITTPPTITSFKRGDNIDTTGMIITGTYTDNVTSNISNITISPAAVPSDAVTGSIIPINVSYTENNITVTTSYNITVIKQLASISITNPPNKIDYVVGDLFDATGMIVTGTYTDGSTSEITSYTYIPTVALTSTDTTITINYTEDSISKSATQLITVTTN